MLASITNRIGRASGQSILLMGIDAALRFLAAIIQRIVAPMGALEGAARAITYALTVPGTLPFVWLTQVTNCAAPILCGANVDMVSALIMNKETRI